MKAEALAATLYSQTTLGMYVGVQHCSLPVVLEKATTSSRTCQPADLRLALRHLQLHERRGVEQRGHASPVGGTTYRCESSSTPALDSKGAAEVVRRRHVVHCAALLSLQSPNRQRTCLGWGCAWQTAARRPGEPAAAASACHAALHAVRAVHAAHAAARTPRRAAASGWRCRRPAQSDQGRCSAAPDICSLSEAAACPAGATSAAAAPG